MLIEEKLIRKLKREGRSIKWFINKYLPNMLYSTVMHQINGFSKINDKTKKAINFYLDN